MPKGSNKGSNNSWPHQAFHDANRSKNKESRENPVWESRAYKYDTCGVIQEIEYKQGHEGVAQPGGWLYEASYEGIKKRSGCVTYNLK